MEHKEIIKARFILGRIVLAVAAIIFAQTTAFGQADDFCNEFGATPSLDSPFAHVPYVFGRVVYKGAEANSRLPRIIVIFSDGQQISKRITVGRSGNYCFRRSGSSATIIVEVDGIEMARRSLTSFGAAQQREDFEILTIEPESPKPGLLSAKFTHPPNPKTTDLYRKAQKAEQEKDRVGLTATLKEIVSNDPADFFAWGRLGSLYLDKGSLADAEAALRKAIQLRIDYTPAWTNFGRLRIELKQYEAAIEVLKHAATLNTTSARTFQLLGEAYLLAKQGSLGAEALNKAIQLDPVRMAECHLQLAHLYQLAGAKAMASKEYRSFLEKIPNHPDRSKFEKFIKENP